MAVKKYPDYDTMLYFWSQLKALFAGKVDKDYKTGSTTVYKTLSDNNLTDTLLTKINDSQTATDVSNAISSAISSSVKYKGSVANLTELEAITGQAIGDMYNVVDNGINDNQNYVWNGTEWDNLGGTMDLSEYLKATDLVAITNSEIDTILAT